MNPVFVILVFVVGFCIWCLLNPIFKLVGKVIQQLIYDIKREMTDEKENDDA